MQACSVVKGGGGLENAQYTYGISLSHVVCCILNSAYTTYVPRKHGPHRLPAYMAMFLAMGMGTSAAKTSFFGSLQAVVCAGTLASL